MLQESDLHDQLTDLLPTPPLPADLPPVDLTDNARQVLLRRYVRRGKDGRPVETVEGMFWRVAYHIAAAEQLWQGEVLARARQYYELLTTKRFFPNSPTFTGAGTPLGQLAACFVLAISDDMGRDPAGIFQTLRDAALIQQTGGGNGFSFSRLRPKGALVQSSAGQATGPVGFLRVYDKAFGEIAQGGCLLPETLVFTSQGLLRLDEIADPATPGWQPHTLDVATDEGPRHSPRAFNNGVAPVLRVHTRQGLSLAGTPEHRVKVMGAEGPEWRSLKDLAPGDWILVSLGQHQGRLQALRQPRRPAAAPAEPPAEPHVGPPTGLPAVLDEELAFFLGCLAGSGFVAAHPEDHRVGVSFSPGSYLLEELPLLAGRLFAARMDRQSRSSEALATLVIDDRPVKEFLELNGLVKPRGREPFIPRLVRQSPPAVAGAYLRGLLETGGSLSQGFPSLTTASARLAEEAATLLIGLGCPVRIRASAPGVSQHGAPRHYQVRIDGEEGLQAWRERVGCDRRSRFAPCYAWECQARRESAAILPNPRYWLQPVLAAISPESAEGRGRRTAGRAPRLRRGLLRYLDGDRQLTRAAFAELRQAHPEFAAHARSPEGLWFVRVSAVEDAGQALTLDLEVDENHTYLAYGMVTHNTRRGANMAVLRVDHPDIEEFITCKLDENAITNFNISVGVTDAFMAAVAADAAWELRFPDVHAPEYRGFSGTLEQAEAAGVPIKVYKTVRARDLFDKIVRQAHHNGEPGVLFLDAANRSNPVPHLYPLEATNPCVTGDTLIYTGDGLRRAADLAASGAAHPVVTDARFGQPTLLPASPVFPTGVKDVVRLLTDEGYELRLTADHRVMTPHGWVPAGELRRNDLVHILNRKGGFGREGSLEEGRLLGWVVAGATQQAHAMLHELLDPHALAAAPAGARQGLFPGRAAARRPHKISLPTHPQHFFNPAGLVEPFDPAEIPPRLLAWAADFGLQPATPCVPAAVLAGCEEMQRGFLQALFTAGSDVDGGLDGTAVCLRSTHPDLLKDVQRLLLNFGIASRIRSELNTGSLRPISRGLPGERLPSLQYELNIAGANVTAFANEINYLAATNEARLADSRRRRPTSSLPEPFLATVVAVEPDGCEPVYDLRQLDTHSFIANGIVVHNCGEQWLGPNENCCLGSVNLAQHLGPNGTVDWEKLRQSVELSTIFLDDVVEANAYVPAVPALQEAAHRARRIGMGIMGLADLMYHTGIRYGSEESQEFAAQVMEYVRYVAMQTSIALARTRGPFPAIAGSIYDPHNMTWSPPQPLAPYTHDWGRPRLDWDAIVAGIRQYGIRNAAQTTVAPTGTIATVAGCEGYGCEPVFALAYIRHVNDNGKDLQLTYASPLFDRALAAAGLDEGTRGQIVQHVMEQGSCQGLTEVPDSIRRTFVISADIHADEHVRIQAALQAFVDNSMSKTINFPENATPEDVATAYQLAWELGCKGITVYVTGSRQKVVLETKATAKGKQPAASAASAAVAPVVAPLPAPVPPAAPADQLMIWHEKKKPRPRSLRGFTYSISTPLGKAFVTINENGGNQPFEVFVNTSKAGSDTAAVSEAIGRLMSYLLRLASPVAPRDRLKEIWRQLSGIGGGRSLGFGPNRVRSLPDGVAQALGEYLESSDPQAEEAAGGNGFHGMGETVHAVQAQGMLKIGDLCPECGQAAVVNEEGCRKCYACAFSEC